MTIIAAIHGIMTRQTDPSWPDHFQAWMSRRDPQVLVLKKEYSAGPLPRLNWLKNRSLARGLTQEILLAYRPGVRLGIVSHSNGAVIALMTVGLLRQAGIFVDRLILTGAACRSDVDENGLRRWTEVERVVGRAVSYSSRNDLVVDHGSCGRREWTHRVRDLVWKWASWPYGDLGRVGFRRNGQPYQTAAIRTRWFDYGHSGYFAPGRLNCMFESFLEDVKR